MLRCTDINKIKIIMIPTKAIFLYFSNKTPIPNENSRTPVNKINSHCKGKKSGIIGKYDSVKIKWNIPFKI